MKVLENGVAKTGKYVKTFDGDNVTLPSYRFCKAVKGTLCGKSWRQC